MINLRAQAKKALFRGDAAAVGQAVEQGWMVDELDANGRSLLWYAAADDRWEQVDTLLALGADPAHAMEGFLCEGFMDPERVKWLAGRLRSVNVILPRGHRALNIASRRGDAKAALALLELGADPALKDGFDAPPLADAMRRFNSDTADALVAAGASVLGSSGKEGNGLAHHAVYWDAPRALDWLLAHGAPLDEPNNRGETPLVRAIALGRIDCARRLIAAGANVNRKGPKGKTPLYWAVATGRSQLALELVAAGADPEAKTGKNGQGKSAVDLARKALNGRDRSSILPELESHALGALLPPPAGPGASSRSKSL